MSWNVVSMKIRGIYSWIFEVYSKNSEYIQINLVHSCGQFECFARAQNFQDAIIVEKYRTVFEVYFNYFLTLTAFKIFLSHSKENPNGNPLYTLV